MLLLIAKGKKENVDKTVSNDKCGCNYSHPLVCTILSIFFFFASESLCSYLFHYTPYIHQNKMVVVVAPQALKR